MIKRASKRLNKKKTQRKKMEPVFIIATIFKLNFNALENSQKYKKN